MPELSHSFSTVREAAAYYIKRGWQVVPLAPGTKAPDQTNWLRLVFKPEDFREQDNIGLRSVNGLIDVDCDAKEIVECAAEFLPATGAVFGRTSKPRSHWLYRSSFDKAIVYKDEGSGSTLIEIRVNHQSMAPPSKHPSGEDVSWNGPLGELRVIEAEELVRGVRLAATTALVARYYNPPGDRHDWGLALAGTLFRTGLSEDETMRVFTQAARIVGDSEVRDRVSAVKTTYSHDDDDAVTSAQALKKLMPDKAGANFLKSLSKVWGTTSSAFILDEKSHKVIPTGTAGRENIKRALEKLDVKLGFDVFSQKPDITWGNRHETLNDQLLNRLWFLIGERYNFLPPIEFFDTVVQDLAWCNQIHPVRAYFKGLNWDGKARIDEWLIKYGGAADNEYTRAVGSMVLVAAVRRITKPGCKFDELMVLESDQGQLKSTALRTLCPDEDWFSDDLPLNVDAKQIIERTRGKWIIEAAELSGMRASQAEHLKSLLSRQVDGPVRMAYARLAVEQPRQFIVIGTTNSHQYLNDMTGNRRFWPIRVKRFDIAKLRADRDQLWAEAVVRELRGDSIRLDPKLYALAAIQQERRRYEHPWEAIMDKHFPLDEKHRLTPDRVWSILAIPVERREERNMRILAQVMQRCGFSRMSVKDEDGKVVKGWARDPKSLDAMFEWEPEKKKEE